MNIPRRPKGNRNMTDIQWLFFDIGNTLIDESCAIHNRLEALIASQKKQGRPLDYDTVIQAMAEASIAYSPPPFYKAMGILGMPEDLEYQLSIHVVRIGYWENAESMVSGQNSPYILT